jgi:hypothetical protein
MSKKKHSSDGNGTWTSSAANQGYIERPSAVENSPPEVTDLFTEQDHIIANRAVVDPPFSYPERAVQEGKTSFGTLGTSPVERKTFRNIVEQGEAKNGRFQHRIIAEIPHKLTLKAGAEIVSDFYRIFEERALPFWAVIHSLRPRNDKQNIHLHLTNFDKPAGKNEEETWTHNFNQIQS